jgi:hypothetical protein
MWLSSLDLLVSILVSAKQKDQGVQRGLRLSKNASTPSRAKSVSMFPEIVFVASA